MYLILIIITTTMHQNINASSTSMHARRAIRYYQTEMHKLRPAGLALKLYK